jgi:HK97 gp10 family phage protein
MTVRVHVDSTEAMKQLKAMSNDVKDKAQVVSLMQAGLVVERAAKIKLSENGRHDEGTPTPSAPGSPPSTITGTLKASVKTFEPTQRGFGKYAILIGPTAEYGRIQELGGGNLPARPYMQPSMDESARDVRNVYINALRRYTS